MKRILLAVLALALASLPFSDTASAQSNGAFFDHDLTEFPLTGRHQTTNCEDCHVDGTFEGTPMNCNVCHGAGSSRAETRPSTSHVPIQTSCSDCHTTRYWEPARMDHSTITGNCSSCHLGSSAQTKPAGHIQSSDQCSDCHGTLSWQGARFDHASIVDN